MKKQQKEKPPRQPGGMGVAMVVANQYSKPLMFGPTALIESRALPLIFVVFRNRTPGVADVCYVSPLVSH